MFLVDSHCHLSFSRFGNAFKDKKNDLDDRYSVDALIKRANDANVKYQLVIGTELADVSNLRDISTRHLGVFRTVGVHPLEAATHTKHYDSDEILRILTENCNDAKTVGIGEIGFDYHYEKESQKQQDKLFNLQLDLAKKHDLPVSIHSRESSDDVLAVLRNHPGARGVIHCFSGEKTFAAGVLDLGFYISVSGTVTYKNAEELRSMLQYIPSDRLLLETDCPFLTPVPHRGQLNEPAFVVFVAEEVARALRTSADSIAYTTSKNFFDLFTQAALFL